MYNHFHRFVRYDEFNPMGHMVMISCREFDCYTSINREMYPPELIGPKLDLVTEEKK